MTVLARASADIRNGTELASSEELEPKRVATSYICTRRRPTASTFKKNQRLKSNNDDDYDEDEGEGERNPEDEGRSKPYEKPINSNYLHAFWSAGGGAGEIRRNEEMSTRAKTFHTNQQK